MEAVERPSDYAEIGGVKVGGQIVGSGPPVLLLHGWGGSQAEWQSNLEALARHFKVYAPNLHQHGLSEPTFEQNLESGRRLFLAFLDAEGLEKVNLVGQSMGGLLALDFALSYPDRVGKLVLVDSAGLGREIHWGLRLVTLPLLGEVVCDFLWPRLRRHLVGRFHITPGAGPGQGSLARLLRMGVGLKGQKLWPGVAERLPTLRMPTLIMWGERDPLFPISQAYAAHRAIPGSKLHIFPHCGHTPAVENPSEFDEKLLEFLREGIEPSTGVR